MTGADHAQYRTQIGVGVSAPVELEHESIDLPKTRRSPGQDMVYTRQWRAVNRNQGPVPWVVAHADAQNVGKIQAGQVETAGRGDVEMLQGF